MSKVTGKVSQIVGPVIDVEFGSGADLPKIYDSLEINRPDGSILVLEVQSGLGSVNVPVEEKGLVPESSRPASSLPVLSACFGPGSMQAENGQRRARQKQKGKEEAKIAV